MQVNPEIAALRGCTATQRRSKAAMQTALIEWRAGDHVAQIETEFAAYARGVPLDDCPALLTLLTDHAEARAFAHGLAGHFIAALRAEPFGEAPFGHRSSVGFARLQIMQERGCMLSLCAFEPIAQGAPPQTAQFIDCTMHEIIVAGRAHGYFHTLEEAQRQAPRVHSCEYSWQVGDCITLRPSCDMRHVTSVSPSLLSLQLTRVPERPQPSREYALADHALLRTTSGDKRASAQVMALGVLGALNDERHLTPMATFALRGDVDADARWEAVRQVLALDTGAGMDLLDRLAGRASDALCAPASDLALTLREQHPQLRERRAG